MANLWKRKFEREGYDVDVSRNGHDALEEMDKDRFDAILLDLYMPVLTGFDVLKGRSKTKSSSSPVYVVTSSLRDEDIDRAKELGARAGFLKYRTSPHEVVDAVMKAA